jgi:3-methyladenine DNA glycosylase AlkD
MRADIERLATSVMAELEAHGSPRNVEGMARYGIRSARAYGVAAPVIQRIARGLGKNHRLAARLWATGILEARAVAALVDDARLVDEHQMERWASDLDSWAICDCVCGKLFDRTPLAWRKARAWSRRREEFVKRAAFSLMAALAVQDKQAPDEQFVALLPLIERAAGDERNMVKKAVNWALRQIGKRNARLNRQAIASAERIRRQASAGRRSASARWIAADALRELRSRAVQARLTAKRAHP